MAAIDEFANSLLEESKRFLEKGREAADAEAMTAFLHASLVLSFCALEAHINAIADELALLPELSIHERALLLEQEVRLENGEFAASGLRMVRIEDRILFLHRRISGAQLDKSAVWWSDLAAATLLRNRLTHPKGVPEVQVDDVARAIAAIIQCLDVVYRAVYRRPFPYEALALHSTLKF